MPLRIGYARKIAGVDFELQKTALIEARCDKIFSEPTKYKEDWPQLSACLAALRKGDTLVVWSLDRIGKDLEQFLALQSALARRGIGFESIVEEVKTSSRTGRIISKVFQALATIRDETQDDSVRCERCEEVKSGKRPRNDCDRLRYVSKVEKVRTLMASSEYSIADVAEMFQLSKSKVYRIWMSR